MWLSHFLFRGQRRVYAYRWLAGTLRRRGHRMGLPESLQLLWQHASEDGTRPGRPSAQAFAAWKDGLAEGEQLGDAMARWVPDSHVMLIKAGERAQRTAESLEMCAWLEESILTIRGKMYGALTSPLVVMTLTLGILIYFGIELIPSLEFLVPSSQWVGVSAYLPGLFWFILDGPLVYTLVGLVIGTVLLVKVILPGWTGRSRQYVEWTLPFKIYRVFAGTYFLVALAGLLRAGVQLDEAVGMLALKSSPWFRSKMLAVYTHLRMGKDPGDALWDADRNFPDRELNRELRVVFTLDDADAVIRELAKKWVESAVTTMERLAGLLRGVAQGFNALLLAMLSVSLFQIVMEINN